MGKTEFIIALTEHRFLGSVFLPYLIKKEEQFYTVIRLVKKRDLNDSPDYNFKPFEKELVELIEKYSDEKLMKRFSRAASVSDFFSSLRTKNFDKQVIPFIEKIMFQIASILMLSPVRLLNKQVKYANLYDEDEIDVQPFFARPVFYFERTETETKYQLQIFLDQKEILLQSPNIKVVTNDPCLLIHNSRLIAFEKLKAKKLTPFFTKNSVSVPNSIEDKYYSGFILNTIRDFEVKAKGFEIQEGEIEKNAMLSLEKNLKYEPCFFLNFIYGNEKFQPNSTRKTSVNLQKVNNEFTFRKIKRNFEWEKEILATIEKVGIEGNQWIFYYSGN